MFENFLNWAFAVTSNGCDKKCVNAIKMELISAKVNNDISWGEFESLINIVNNNICLTTV